MLTNIIQTQNSYDAIAKEYAEQFQDEMDHKPFDREMLQRLVDQVGELGTICDLGCGPGQIARYLHTLGAPVCGIDLSPEMVKQARLLNSEIPFQQGDMLDLKRVEDNSLGGIAAFYCIIHIARADVVTTLRELKRVLRPGGTLLVTFHIGQEIIRRDDWWDKPVSVDFIFYEPTEMQEYLSQAGYEQIEIFERAPYKDVEYQSRRAYIFAVKPTEKT